MKMLSVCATTPTCSHSQTTSHGVLRSLFQFRKDTDSRSILEDRVVFGLSGESHLQKISYKTQAAKSLYSDFIEGMEGSLSMDFIDNSSCRNQPDNIKCSLIDPWGSTSEVINELHPLRSGELIYAENPGISSTEEGLMDFADQSKALDLIGPMEPETLTTVAIPPQNAVSMSNSQDVGNDQLSTVKTKVDDFFAGANEYINSSLNKGENTVKNSRDSITSLLSSTTKSTSDAVDSALSRVFSTVDQTGEYAGSKLTSFSSGLKEASSKASVLALDSLRRTIIVGENLISKGVSLIVDSYGSVKELLPPEIRGVLNLSEEKAVTVLRPVGTTFQQVYFAIEGLEKDLGFDPSDPIVPFVLFIGTSATLWIFYWVRTYGGYAGDLSPELTLELLTGKESAVLIDVRPEVLRERDGIPDLRRAARFRYASVTLPEVDGKVMKLLRSGRELDDMLIAAVIRNLRSVQDRSKVIVMDADGGRSKGIARSLRKLGVKRPYQVQGGFQSWVKQGLRFKELKPETTFTILNEEAEAILEDIRPSPVQVLGCGLGLVAALFALQEWEKTLQLIGIFGLGQTIYKRVASYEDVKDFQRDVRLLLAPARLGAQAFSWAAGRLETNRIGLPTSPSSLDVQNRVLQAAAKHESQPSDPEGIQNPPLESLAPNENADLSEA
ncbi:hypothetical protein HS088_TW16G00381 [Tripterygium wilfordii]|uniref:Rhodanese domain-containing protein n=1 Tax=Tripterygium wilfordii TaxID=458696 RepID=A0A7J7CIR3_TRIWF|nr:uncharacterized protein LOC119980256 [Tripterygium wilfordii]XP_038678811.1 uncharacterized protein LOC119980256 [Tripterygium wilfordii]KAF5733940.1 hypothetical protein HS088_TW16G00381 [Tripterygium wilfordii]